MPLQYQNLLLNDFSGGITDKFIGAPNNTARKLDNFLISEYGKPSTRWGTEVKFDQDSIQRIMGLFKQDADLFVARGTELYIFNSVGPALDLVTKPNGVEPFFQYTGNTSYPSAVEWRNQLHLTNTGQESPLQYNRPMRVWRDENAALQSTEMGIPAVSDTVTFVYDSPGSGSNYIYAIHYSYTYKVGDITFKNVGLVLKKAVDAGADIGVGTGITINTVPVLSSVNNQLDLTNFKVELYRTEKDGSTFYKQQEITHGTTSFVKDETTDAALIGNALLYNDGGLLEHDRIPKCKYMVVTNDTAYALGVVEETTAGDEFKPYRVQQSFPGIPSASDPSFFVDLDDDIVGGSHIGGVPIVFTETFVYRLEGQIDSLGNGIIRKRVISDTAGCVSHKSIQRTNAGVFWMGKDGVYVTDGFNVQNISNLPEKSIQETYSVFVTNTARQRRVTSLYDKSEERVYWSVADNDTENNKMLVLNLKTQGFTTISGFQFFPTDAIYDDDANEIIRGDNQGYLYTHNENILNDLQRDVLVASSLWETRHIPYDFESIAVDFGTPAVRKWVSELTASIKSDTKFSILPASNNDDRRIEADMTEMRVHSSFFWDDPNFIWNDPEIAWRTAEVQTKQRHFPRESMRCRRKQVRLRPAKSIRYKSDVWGAGTITEFDPGVSPDLVVTIEGGASAVWPTDVLGQDIYFEDDNYTNPHQIKTRTNTTLRIAAGGAQGLGAGKKWHIRGFNKNQRFSIESLALKFAPLSNEGNKFQADEEGTNS